MLGKDSSSIEYRVYLNLYQESTTSAEETLLKSAGAR